MAVYTVGSALKPMPTIWARAFSIAMNKMLSWLAMAEGKTVYGKIPAYKIFIKASSGAPSSTTGNPGSDLCFIWNSSDNELYFIHTWVSASSYTVVKVIA